MTAFPHSSDSEERYQGERVTEASTTSGDACERTVSDLRLAVVRYDDRPDRGTIHPPGLTGVERMETWLSVDMSLVTDLSTWR